MELFVFSKKIQTPLFSQLVDKDESDIVSGFGVFGSWVAEANDKFHREVSQKVVKK